MSDPENWHRLFGYAWIDFFRGTDAEVQMEADFVVEQFVLAPAPARSKDVSHG